MTNAWMYQGAKEQAPLHYKQCGLDDIYLLSGYEIVETDYGRGVSVKDADDLHRAIGHYLASQKKILSGKELRFLRKQMNLTQGDLGQLLGLSSQQVARWEKEECEVSGPADRLLRALYLEFAGDDMRLEELTKALDELDAPLDDKSFFENTGHEWRARKAA